MTHLEVADWIGRKSHPLTDLTPLREIVGDGVVVGIGESSHGGHELFEVKGRLLRFLVEHLGFRAVAWEYDWTLGRQVDEYVTNGVGDLKVLLADAIIVWRTEEILAELEWLRAFNEAHPDDKVRFVGVDILSSTGDVTAEEAQLRHEQATDPLDVQETKVALASHTFAKCGPQERFGYRDQQMAENTIWWHEQAGAKIVYWAHNVHTANDAVRMSTGAHLRAHFGQRYVSIGTTFDHGSSNVGLPTMTPRDVPPPQGQFADAAFGTDEFLIDLRAQAPEAVREWLTEPTSLRVVGPAYDASTDADHKMTNGALAGWFDAIVHIGLLTPSRVLG
jgi:erythromycin esterase